MKKDTVNIYDIAKLAKVSIATVSRVVNGSEKVSPKTREKVMAVIEEVGYTPNVFAQGLGLNTMHTIGVLVPTIADPYMASAVAHLEKELAKYGYDCILSCSGFAADLLQTQSFLIKGEGSVQITDVEVVVCKGECHRFVPPFLFNSTIA